MGSEHSKALLYLVFSPSRHGSLSSESALKLHLLHDHGFLLIHKVGRHHCMIIIINVRMLTINMCSTHVLLKARHPMFPALCLSTLMLSKRIHNGPCSDHSLRGLGAQISEYKMFLVTTSKLLHYRRYYASSKCEFLNSIPMDP